VLRSSLGRGGKVPGPQETVARGIADGCILGVLAGLE
jgi:hypothetical protein